MARHDRLGFIAKKIGLGSNVNNLYAGTGGVDDCLVKGHCKSAFGFKVGRICPYFQAVDFVYGETTCDAKKKTWEILDRYVPTHVMEIPQKKGPRDRVLWLEEVKEFKGAVEKVTGKVTGFEEIASATRLINDKRRALQRLNNLRHKNPSNVQNR